MKNLFQQSRFFNLKLAISLVVLFFAIVMGAAFGLPWHQKHNAFVAIVTSEGDAGVMEGITLDGIISKNGYQANFSLTGGQEPQIQMNTRTLAPDTRRMGWWFLHIPSAFQSEVSFTDALIDETNSSFLLAEGAEKTLLSREKMEEEFFGQQDGRREIYENLYQADLVVPAFCFIDAESRKSGFYLAGADHQMLADYTIAAQENGWEMEYCQREYLSTDAVNEDDNWQEDPYWKNQTVPDAPTCTNYLQLSAILNGETYVALPTLAGAVGQNGIYRMTLNQENQYIGYGQVCDLGDSSIRADYMAQREAIYTYGIQTEGAPDRITCGMIAHKDVFFLLTAQVEAPQKIGVGDAAQLAISATQKAGAAHDGAQAAAANTVEDATVQETALTLTVIDPITGTVLDTVFLGNYPLQEDCPPMLYQNENYLSIGIAIAAGANQAAPEYGGFTVLSFAFDAKSGMAVHSEQAKENQAAQNSNVSESAEQGGSISENGRLQLCDTTTFVRYLMGDATCLQDVYFNGNTLFLMETSMYNVGDEFDPKTIYNANFLGRYLTQRMMAFQGGDCVWQGYLSTDIYQDYLRDYYDSWSSERMVSNLKFHQEGEVRP